MLKKLYYGEYCMPIKFYSAIIVIFIFVEVLLRMINPSVNGVQLSSSIPTFFSNEFYDNPLKDYFCDHGHKTHKGNVLVAECLRKRINVNYLKGEDRSFLALGGSTTDGFSCNSNNSWVEELDKSLINVNIVNYGKGGENSDYSIKVLEKHLKNNKKVDVVFWNEGNEFMFFGNNKDLNYKELIREFPNIEKDKNASFKDSFLILVYRVNSLFYKLSYSYRFVKKIFFTNKKNISDFSKMFSNFKLSDPTERDRLLLKGGLFSSPLRHFFSDFSIKYSSVNFSLNLDNLYKMSKAHNFKVICVNQPFNEHFFHNTYSTFNKRLNKYYESISKTMKQKCKSYNFQYIDAHKCLKEYILKN